MTRLHWSLFMIFAIVTNTTRAAFEDFVINSKEDLQRFDNEDELIDASAEFTDESCSYADDSNEQTLAYNLLQQAMQDGQIDEEALRLSLQAMANDPGLRQLLNNAAHGYSIDIAQDSFYEPSAEFYEYQQNEIMSCGADQEF